MKKRSIIISCMFISGLLLSGLAQAKSRHSAYEEKLVAVCVALKDNKKMALRKAVENLHVGYKNIARGLKCNGMDPITFALSHNAKDVAQFVANRSDVDYDDMLAKL